MDVIQNGSKLVRAFKKIPGPKLLPIVGNLYLYKLGIFNIEKYPKVLRKLYDTYGPIVREKIGPATVIHVFDPEDAKTINMNEGKAPYIVPLLETTQLYRKKAEMSLGLGNTNGEEWYRLRAAVRHLMLKPKDVQQFLPGVHQVAQDFVRRIHVKRDNNGIVPNLANEFGKWSQESAAVVCFDKRLGYLNDGPQQQEIEEVLESNRILFYLSTLLKYSLPIYKYKYIPTPKWKRLVDAEDIAVRITKKYLDEAFESIERLALENQLSDRYGFLLSLLAKQELSKKDIFIITFSLYNDGMSTTVPTVLFNLFALATNPDAQQKAFDEVSAVVGSADVITPAHLNRLNYIKAIVKETFRVYPNGVEISRTIKEDLVLSGYHIPAQTNVSINMGVHLRSEKYFKNPDQYLPERWLRSEAAENIHPYLLTPFGLGTRTCAGRRFAEQDMYVLLTEIVRHFRLAYDGEEPMEQVYHMLLKPAKDYPIRFIPRHQ